MLKIATLVIVLMAFVTAGAQTRTFKWSDELCEYSGTYNAKNYTETQLRNTLRLFSPGEFSLAADTTAFTIDEIAKLDVEKLDREYKIRSEELASLAIVPSPFFERLRNDKLAELKQVYDLSRVSMQAYRDASILKTFNGAESCKTTYASPLIAGGDALLAVWKQVNLASRAKNSDPERLRRLYEGQLNSPDRMKYATVEVVTFGWWNCANDGIKYVSVDGSQEREFRKLFIRVRKLQCDEP